MNNGNNILIIDTSALIAGFDPFKSKRNIISIYDIEEELSKVGNSFLKLRFKLAVERGLIKLLEPKSIYTELIKKNSIESGDFKSLSKIDIKLLALALNFKEKGYCPLILTDDYAIQNVATKINVKFTSLLTFGIKSLIYWTLYCPACKKKYSSNYNFAKCKICGSILKRKAKKILNYK